MCDAKDNEGDEFLATDPKEFGIDDGEELPDQTPEYTEE